VTCDDGEAMERINRRDALRTQFMNELYEMADGSQTNFVPTKDIAERLGLVFEYGKDIDEVFAIVQYLEDERLIEVTGGEYVNLTHFGIREVEQAHRQPDEPTQHLAPINLVSVSAHTITNSPIQQGSPGATQSLTVLSQDHQSQLEAIVQSLKTSIDDLELGDEDKAELEAEVQTLEAQLASPKPKKEVIRPGLQSVRRILEGAASQTTASGLLEAIQTLSNSL
jgi:CHAT domain-containing protein